MSYVDWAAPAMSTCQFRDSGWTLRQFVSVIRFAGR
jgi:hypothetical protein